MAEISIVVPVYRVEAYLRPCVDSLLAQTFSDIEIILVDDGSPDSCGSICDEYAAKDRRVRVLHQKNSGLSRARNAGVRQAAGRYICFVDSDDLVCPRYCQVLYRLLDGSGYDFSVCAAHRFRDGEAPCPAKGNGGSTVLDNAAYLGRQLRRESEFGVWNKLYRRELFETLSFAPGKLHEDVIWSGDLARNLHSGVISTDEELYLYRQRESGIVASHKKRCSPDFIYAGEYLIETARQAAPELVKECLHYAAAYPWSFVDPIYVRRDFAANREFLEALGALLRNYQAEYQRFGVFEPILMKRMCLFSKSPGRYGLNAYARLLRVYGYRILKKDPYADGHGI